MLDHILTRMDGCLSSHELQSSVLRAMLGPDDRWDDHNQDRQPLVYGLLQALNWELDRVEEDEGRHIRRLSFVEAEQLYLEIYRKIYKGGEIATSWPDAMPDDPDDELLRFPETLIQRLALVLASRDNAIGRALDRASAEWEDYA